MIKAYAEGGGTRSVSSTSREGRAIMRENMRRAGQSEQQIRNAVQRAARMGAKGQNPRVQRVR